MNTVMLGCYRDDLANKRLLETKIKHLKEDLEARQSWITPTGENWKALGTSEDDRKHVLQKILADDKICIEIRAAIREAELEQARIEARIDEIEAVRRNDEGITNRLLAEALHVKYLGAGLVEQAEATSDAVGEAAYEVLDAGQGPADDIPF